MPATYAHYKFGKAVYRILPQDIRQIIRENRPAYFLGLHGPDLLFYYHPYRKNRVNQIGVQMHREAAAVFFEKARKIYQEKPSYVLLSYLCGFMCHFILDTACHPYITSYMRLHQLGHMEIETDFDRDLMEEDGYDPVRHICTRHLIRDLDTEEAAASVLGVTADQVDESILGFHRTIRMFQCPNEAKAVVLKYFFTLIGEKKGLGGLIMTAQPHKDCRESRHALRERMDFAVKTAGEEVTRYVRGIETDEKLSFRLDRDFE